MANGQRFPVEPRRKNALNSIIHYFSRGSYAWIMTYGLCFMVDPQTRNIPVHCKEYQMLEINNKSLTMEMTEKVKCQIKNEFTCTKRWKEPCIA